MPRLFTAIEIPADAATSLAMLRGGLPSARWVDPDNYHITLRFIGDVDARTANEIVDALSRVRRTQFSVRISGLNAFGGNKPHSVFAGVERSQQLTELQCELERVMQRAGLKAEGRKFSPHITLARLRGVKGTDVAAYLALRGGFSLPSFEAQRFVLYSSRASVGGGPYIIEDAYPLSQTAPEQVTDHRYWQTAAQ